MLEDWGRPSDDRSADYRKLLKIKYGRGRQEVYFQNINPSQCAEWIEGHESGS